MPLYMISQFLSIARNTFIESIRQPVFVVLILVGGLALVMNPNLAAYTLDDDNKLLVDLGLSTLFIVGLLLAAFTATSVVSNEIENKTVLTVISKPVSRPLFVVGKFFGVGGAIGVAYWVLTMVFLLTIRHRVQQTAGDYLDWPVLIFGLTAIGVGLLGAAAANYFYHWVFTSTFVVSFAVLITLAWGLVLNINKYWLFQPIYVDFDLQLMIGLALVFMAVLILTAVAVAASTRLGQIMTLLVCTGAFLIGLVSEYFLGNLAQEHPWFTPIYAIVPNLQLLWPADALTLEHDYEAGLVLLIAAYTCCMIGAFLCAAVALFQTRDVG